MKLIEALEAIKQNPAPEAQALEIDLACGFAPLHFLTFLNAHLRRQFPGGRVLIETGLFGDLQGNLERLKTGKLAAVVAVIEWPDLDPRLGIRRLGGWLPRQLPGIVHSVREQTSRLADVIQKIGLSRIVTLVLPTLPLPPAAFTPGWQSSAFENALREAVASLGARLSAAPGIRVISSQRLERVSPPALRFDVRSELTAGFPYTVSHADALAELVARALRSPAPKKGLITDLDDTLWMGILGEVNADGIAWDLDRRAQKHGLYQQLLASLAEAGVLVAVATKNDPALVEEAFQRATPMIGRERIFPVEAGWAPKSESVSRILRAWNIAADSAVFIDDSPLDLAEVKAAHPEIECLRFPDDDAAAYQFLEELRDRFGKQSISAEDEIRLESLRTSRVAAEVAQSDGHSHERFLQQAEGKLSLAFSKDPPDPRALELVNKTNQFNLNGKRHTEASWKEYLSGPEVFLLLASYEDKFGPLGKIAVIAGRQEGPQEGQKVVVDHWVMSCRAFSRRIEHACLVHLLQRFGAAEATFDFASTPRNGPLRDFFADLTGATPAAGLSITARWLGEKCPPLYLQVREYADG